MKPLWRLLDTGIKSASENIALDSVLLEARAKGEIPNTLRFLQFSPLAVLVGYHQTIDHEVRRDYCQKKGIDVNRRITGRGAIYFDLSQLGFEIIASLERVTWLSRELGKGTDLKMVKEALVEGFKG